MDQIVNFNKILKDFKIKASCVNYKKIYQCSYYDIRLDPLGKVKDIEKYIKEISLALKEETLPKINVILEQGLVQLEFIKPQASSISYFELANSAKPPSNQEIPILLGLSSCGEEIWMDLQDNPHLLIAGCTGSGKSVALHNIIANVLKFTPKANLFLVDPKGIEFNDYESFDNVGVKYSFEECLELLENLEHIMNLNFLMIRRGVNKNMINPTVVIIDEYADLSLQDSGGMLYSRLCKLAQKCRAAKIHIVLATQRPSVKLLDGNIKANFPARLACKVSSKIDSKIILDESGAEELKGKGDAILNNSQHSKVRLKIAYTTSQQIKSNIKHGN
jgi:S-DNA-T family DNA segregation ATPase FtsK/SpoIIIE